jgi:hypothetical protein
VIARGDRWPRAIGYGLLAEVATIVTIIVIALTYRYAFARGISDSDYADFAMRTGEVVGILGGTIYTFLFARLLMRAVGGNFVAHGVVLAVTAIAFSVAGSLAGHHGLPGGYVVASLLKLLVGALAGFLAVKRRAPAGAA